MSSIKLFTVSGMDVKVHYSLFIVIAFLTWIFNVQSYPYGFKGMEFGFFLSFVTSLSLFIAVFLHELGHSFLSIRMGYPVREIVLFIFGGVSVLERHPRGIDEVKVSVAGPSVSFLIALIFYIVSQSHIFLLREFSEVFYRINLIIGIFNLLPAFPLDGGRILRGFMAEKVGFTKATSISAEIGKGMAVFMAIFGLIYNLWLTFIAIFIYLGASEEEKLSRMESLLERLKVGEIMTENVKTVSKDMRVEEFISFVFKNKHLGYPVVEDDRLVGIVTLHDVVGKGKETRIEDIMKRDVVVLSPDDPSIKAFRIMNETGLGRIPVVKEGRVLGIISKTDLLRLMEIEEVLKVGRK